MADTKINSIQEFFDNIKSDSDWIIYRGVSKKSYPLVPSIGRRSDANPENVLYYEERLFSEFKRRCPAFLNSLPTTELEWLCLAQHHGLPTRLLDWTTNPLVALYFAAEKDFDSDCAVYSYSMEDGFIDDFDHIKNRNPFKYDEIMPIFPKLFHPRFNAQSALFTIHPEPWHPILESWPMLEKMVFSKDMKQGLLKWLAKNGINKSVLFPGLEGLSNFLAWKNGYYPAE